MARLRYNKAEAEAEAIRLATAFIQTLPKAESARFLHARPDRMAPKSPASKYPVVWRVMFVHHPPEVIMDGGETTLIVNLETRTVEFSPF